MKALYFAPVFLLFFFSLAPKHYSPPEEKTFFSGEKTGTELFDSEDLLNIKLTGNVRDAFGDRSAKPKYFSFSLYYQGEGSELRTPVRIKTRGHFRRDKSNCSYPPLLLNFTNKD